MKSSTKKGNQSNICLDYKVWAYECRQGFQCLALTVIFIHSLSLFSYGPLWTHVSFFLEGRNGHQQALGGSQDKYRKWDLQMRRKNVQEIKYIHQTNDFLRVPTRKTFY